MELDKHAAGTVLPRIDWERIAGPLSRASDALARLDERLRASSLAEGWGTRTDFREAQAALWIDGILVSIEDLVLHDAGMDVRIPTPELTRSVMALGLRRRIWRGKRDWPGSEEGLNSILGSSAEATTQREVDDWFSPKIDHRDKMTEWRELLGKARSLTPLVGAALALDAWRRNYPSERTPWAGSMIIASYLRETGATANFLPLINIGLREGEYQKQRNRESSQTDRVIWILEAFEASATYGMTEHDHMVLARDTLSTKLKERRTSSRMPDLVELVLSHPIVTVPLVAKKLRISPQAAQVLIDDCGTLLREVTGRKRYRAWSIGT